MDVSIATNNFPTLSLQQLPSTIQSYSQSDEPSRVEGGHTSPFQPSHPRAKDVVQPSIETSPPSPVAIFTILNIITLATLFGHIVNPFFWIWILLNIVHLAVNVFGFLAVFRVIPEWMAAYGWALLVFLGVDVAQFISYLFVGGFFSGIVTLAFQALFTVAMISCLIALRAYGFACRGLGI
ncbi:hypothetical protein BCR33DRAFT_768764 [Rhizoclosmatium globosum]|uniref:Uncharacterized protein n=1 Tax=Rhizoclosmatium globosum TaxID=329046 RepID=A0A1Y2BZD5_9FUNG|nr:hypothetical protein BCR33DRAFT_768764 [Rhizoclosmatium globosum]|eukprot:ORY39435.1 hypothetical protein BCR33DRAFT_768764 [Rhizoclosmatium globosum]